MSDLTSLLAHIGVVSNLHTEESILDYVINGPDLNSTVYADADIAAKRALELADPSLPAAFQHSLAGAMGFTDYDPSSQTPESVAAALEAEAEELGVSVDLLKTMKKTEVEAVAAASSKSATLDALEGSVASLTSLITSAPLYASALNNRAQARQLWAIAMIRHQQKVDKEAADAVTSASAAAADASAGASASTPSEAAAAPAPKTEGARAALKKAQHQQLLALSDLNQAIHACQTLYARHTKRAAAATAATTASPAPAGADGAADGTPASASAPEPAPYRPPRALLQAFCQRAALHRLRGNDDAALADLHRAAELGSTWAQREQAAVHPVAQLNKEMLAEVLEEQAPAAAAAVLGGKTGKGEAASKGEAPNEDASKGEKE